jgi:hypothetical protein
VTAAAEGRGRSFGDGEDVGRYLTYIGESLGFFWGFRVGLRPNRLVRDNGSGKREGKQARK